MFTFSSVLPSAGVFFLSLSSRNSLAAAVALSACFFDASHSANSNACLLNRMASLRMTLHIKKHFTSARLPVHLWFNTRISKYKIAIKYSLKSRTTVKRIRYLQVQEKAEASYVEVALCTEQLHVQSILSHGVVFCLFDYLRRRQLVDFSDRI